MAITVEEKFGRRLSDDSAEVLYLIRGTADDVAARTELLATAPATHDGLVLDDAEVEEIEGLDAYLGSVRYIPEEFTEPQTGSSSFTFDTSGGTQRITQSRATTRYAPAGKTAPDFKGAIGVTDDAVEGVEITVPGFAFEITRRIASASMTQAYIGDLYTLTGSINDGQFTVTTDDGITLSFAAGECLFLGAGGGKREGEDDWEIRFRFSGSPNRTNITVGDITVASKKGWDYLWVRYGDVEDSTAKALVKRPIAAYVEQVLPAGNFSLLGV